MFYVNTSATNIQYQILINDKVYIQDQTYKYFNGSFSILLNTADKIYCRIFNTATISHPGSNFDDVCYLTSTLLFAA